MRGLESFAESLLSGHLPHKGDGPLPKKGCNLIVMKPLALAFGAVLSLIASCGGGNTTPVVSTSIVPVTHEAPTTTAPTPTTTTAPATTTTTTQPPLVLGFTPKCPVVVELAYRVGWPEHELKKLDLVAHRESRCRAEAHNASDPSKCGSRGWLQVNGSWVLPNKWWPIGFLPHYGIVQTCDELFDGEKNLRAGLLLFYYSLMKHGDGWVPWRATAYH